MHNHVIIASSCYRM
uniref:Uncharacterized protein n=1 Tax=Rhizophora mucronata TaxID=61149 RepID=A0A2P2IIT0_RHIMU